MSSEPTIQRSNIVLVACDLGGTTQIVLERGMFFADLLNARPILLHVDVNAHLLREGLGPLDDAQLVRMAQDYDGEARASLLRIAAWSGVEVEPEIILRQGKASTEILREAEVHPADLLVVGSRAHRGLEHLLLGRTAIRVARAAPCPILTVQVERPWTGLKRMVIATDLTSESDPALQWGAMVAARSGATLTIVYVSPVGGEAGTPYFFSQQMRDEIEERVQSRLDAVERQASALSGHSVTVGTMLRHDADAAAGIREAAAETDADLCVIGSHGRRGLARALLGSVAAGVVRRAPTNIVTVHV